MFPLVNAHRRWAGAGRPGRRIGALLILLAFLLLAPPLAAQSAGAVLLLDVEGPVTPAMAGYFARGVEEAAERGATAVVIQLDTPGGSVDTTKEIIQLFRGSSVPVIVYVGPSGAQAASAGSLITIAAQASGMAPETVIGAASPVSGEGEDLNETMFRKVTEDLKAQVRGLTARRGEEAQALAEAMIEEARAVNATEALQVGLIDAVADDVPDLLQQLDGRTVRLGEEEVTLNLAEAPLTPLDMNALEQLLHALANPLLLGILMAIGVQSILIELSNPGGWVAGFIGVLCLGMGLYGLGQLPVNWLGMGLIIIAFALFIAEVFASNHGVLGVTGAVTLLAGLLVLFNSPGTPAFARISLAGAVTLSAVTAAFFVFIATKALGAQRSQPTTGAEGLVGRKGVVRGQGVTAASQPGLYVGTVLVNGELWRAEAGTALPAGTPVKVTAVENFTLTVKATAESE